MIPVLTNPNVAEKPIFYLRLRDFSPELRCFFVTFLNLNVDVPAIFTFLTAIVRDVFKFKNIMMFSQFQIIQCALLPGSLQGLLNTTYPIPAVW
jgi:hypothetical protein